LWASAASAIFTRVAARACHSSRACIWSSVPPRMCASSPRKAAGVDSRVRTPTVPIERLHRLWIDGAIVLYIGKAGGGDSGALLQERLWAYMRFGASEPVGHWGGRLIWQLENCHDLTICWKACVEVDAAKREGELIREFAKTHGRRPFANLRN
jgi:hypothetical protein